MKCPIRQLALFALTSSSLANARETYQQRLNVSATTAIDGTSVLQCWQLTTPMISNNNNNYGLSGLTRLFLGNLANATYAIFPPRSDLGYHNAPHMQWVVALAGLAYVTLPNTTAGPKTTSWQQGGRYGLLFAADTKDVSKYGHGTAFPGDAETVLLMIPVAGNTPPDHTVLYDGPCQWPELVGGTVTQPSTDYVLHDEI